MNKNEERKDSPVNNLNLNLNLKTNNQPDITHSFAFKNRFITNPLIFKKKKNDEIKLKSLDHFSQEEINKKVQKKFNKYSKENDDFRRNEAPDPLNLKKKYAKRYQNSKLNL